MSNFEETIRSAIRNHGRPTAEILSQIDAALTSDPSAGLWILRGDAIQLSDGDGYDLADAEQSYQRAIELEPSLPEPYESLGYFHFAVMDELPNTANGAFHIRDESIAKTPYLPVEVGDLFLKLRIRFLEKALRFHSFLARARRKTSSPSTALLLPASKSA